MSLQPPLPGFEALAAPPPELDSGPIDSTAVAREVDPDGWPTGYCLRATRYADIVLKRAFPDRFADLVRTLEAFSPSLAELRAGGGGRSQFVKRFDDSLGEQHGGTIWGKANFTIAKTIALGGTTVAAYRTRDHEIDMFGRGSLDEPVPGVAVEMEWNNKDPFFDRDLISFQALHREGAIAVGVIVTRGPRLQELISSTVRSAGNQLKYGSSSTHWDKLVPRVNLGGGGECPMLLIGIEPERIEGIELARDVARGLAEARRIERSGSPSKAVAKKEAAEIRRRALDLMPPLGGPEQGADAAEE